MIIDLWSGLPGPVLRSRLGFTISNPQTAAGPSCLGKLPSVNFIRHRLRAWTWTALVAVLALALLPTVSRAWGLGAEPVGIHAMVEVCTTDGLRMVPIGEGQASPNTPAHHADAFARCAHNPRPHQAACNEATDAPLPILLRILSASAAG